MKPITIAALVALGVFVWYKHSKGTSSIYNMQSGVQGGNLSPSTIPAFSTTIAANTPGQTNAYLTTNQDATMAGGGQYVPAFGPNENQPDSEMFF